MGRHIDFNVFLILREDENADDVFNKLFEAVESIACPESAGLEDFADHRCLREWTCGGHFGPPDGGECSSCGWQNDRIRADDVRDALDVFAKDLADSTKIEIVKRMLNESLRGLL